MADVQSTENILKENMGLIVERLNSQKKEEAKIQEKRWGFGTQELCLLPRDKARLMNGAIGFTVEETLSNVANAMVTVKTLLCAYDENDMSYNETDGHKMLINTLQSALRYEQWQFEKQYALSSSEDSELTEDEDADDSE